MSVRDYYTALGFDVADTGGGCLAFQKQARGLGLYVLVTDAEDPSLPDDLSAPVVAGLYAQGADHSECIAYIEAESTCLLLTALRAGRWSK